MSNNIFPIRFDGYSHELTVKEYRGQRVVTLKDVDELHRRVEGTASRNFRENRLHFISETDYFYLQGSEATEFATTNFVGTNPSKIRELVLLTQSGYSMLVKSFTDDLAWDVQRQLVNGYFNAQDFMKGMDDLSPILQFMIKSELEQKALRTEVTSLQDGLNTLTDSLTAVPDAAKVKDLINEYQRWTRIDHDQIYKSIYDILLEQHGYDIPRRVKNDRQRLDDEYCGRTGRHYAEKTLKAKVTGIDVMVRMGVLDKFHSILIGKLAKAKGERRL
ncbi:ORF6N domain-containing protein [Paenibacillus sp. NRS-1780]|uniref:ORF6N domain-containing protein n=1 Tax=Paenibacillus sp. NRS-1780 TaxID=3233904 RepID=UPI003D28AC45